LVHTILFYMKLTKIFSFVHFFASSNRLLRFRTRSWYIHSFFRGKPTICLGFFSENGEKRNYVWHPPCVHTYKLKIQGKSVCILCICIVLRTTVLLACYWHYNHYSLTCKGKKWSEKQRERKSREKKKKKKKSRKREEKKSD